MRTLFPEKFVPLKRNSIIRKQFMRERLNLGSQANAYTKISCKSLWSDVNSPRKAWFVQPSQTVNMQWVRAVLRQRSSEEKHRLRKKRWARRCHLICLVLTFSPSLSTAIIFWHIESHERSGFRVVLTKKKKTTSKECKRLETIERLNGHSQLWDCADLDTTFVSLKSVYLNPKSNVRVGNEHVHQLTVSL